MSALRRSGNENKQAWYIVLDLEKVKTAQEKEIASLKKRVTKIEQRKSLRILGFHSFRTSTSKRYSLGRRNVSKQARKNLKSQQKFQDIDDLVDKVVKKEVAQQETVSTARPDISAARQKLSTAEPKTPHTIKTFFDDEYVTIADTLVKMKNHKAKEKRVAFKDVDDSARPIRSITTLQTLPTIDLKDKDKGILQEPKPVKKTKKRDKDQIERDAKVTLKIQADLDKENHIVLGKLSAINGFEISLPEAVCSGIARESSDKVMDSTKKRKAGSRMKRMSKRQKTNADLEYFAKHNMVAYLEKTDGNTEFHKMVDFLTCSSIHYALTVSPDVYTLFIKQFWNSATSKTLNNVSQIKAKVAGQRVVIIEASIRRDFLFNDVDGIDCLSTQAIFENLALMGYEEDLTKLTFQKALFSPQWEFLIHTVIHCLSSKSTSWDQFPTHIASAVTPLFPSMLAQAAVEEGEGSRQPTGPQPTPSPAQPSIGDQTHETASSSSPENTQSPMIVLEGTGGLRGDQTMEHTPNDSPYSCGETSGGWKDKDAQATDPIGTKSAINACSFRYRAWMSSKLLLLN
uniref:Synaptobrevin, longin-like domain protein n=1 Tax=Tanacetum cinerariifolium TaxID=118510 RepID=A0A6L2KTK0_TANCI|nr:hypothetical protein [Tanacetum cinerariifolium]